LVNPELWAIIMGDTARQKTSTATNVNFFDVLTSCFLSCRAGCAGIAQPRCVQGRDSSSDATGLSRVLLLIF
jgi:hypothetical protein